MEKARFEELTKSEFCHIYMQEMQILVLFKTNSIVLQ